METTVFRYVETGKISGEEIIHPSVLAQATRWWKNPIFRKFIEKNHLRERLLVAAKGPENIVLIAPKY